MTKESLSYAKMANLVEPPDMPPKDVPLDRLCYAYSAGTYRLCAKAIRDVIKQVKKDEAKKKHT